MRELELRVRARQEAERELIERRCAERVASGEAGPLYWLQNWTRTENPKYMEQGVERHRPFPKKSYFLPLFDYFLKEKRLFVPKSREMLTSWAVMGYATWLAQWRPGSETIVQTEKEAKVVDLVRYAEVLWEQQPAWLRERHPLAAKTRTRLRWANGSVISGVPQGADQIRHSHPTLYVMDEAAFLTEAGECYDNAHPVAEQIVAISSAAPGWFGEQCGR